MKKGAAIAGVVLIAGLVVFFVLEGRFMLEGGRAPWAVINDDMGVLEQTLEEGVSQEELQKAFGRAVGRDHLVALRLLADRGAEINRHGSGCYLASSLRFGRPGTGRALLQLGADPNRCDVGRAKMMEDAIVFGHDRVPQQDMIYIMSKLYTAGVDVAPAKASAASYHLDQVGVYLDAPGADVVAVSSDPALLPRGEPGSVEWDDLKALCEGGTAPTAAAYQKQEGASAPIAFFERRFETWRWPGVGAPGQVRLPRWWLSFKEPANTQLVACVEAIDPRRVKECRYEGRGGGISVYDTTWKITIREAKTGTVVDEQSFAMQASRSCDILKHGTDQEGQFPFYGQKLKTMLAPHVGGPS